MRDVVQVREQVHDFLSDTSMREQEGTLGLLSVRACRCWIVCITLYRGGHTEERRVIGLEARKYE
jgi:hypothetical protein